MKRLLLDLLSPPRCLSCEERLPLVPGKAAPPLCPACAMAWESALRAQCKNCFSAYPECRCVTPAMQKAGVTALVKLAPYGEGGDSRVIRHMVTTLKHSKRKRLLLFLAAELAPGIREMLSAENIKPADCVLTFLPRAGRGVRRYGTDQAKALAEALSTATGIPAERLLKRRRDGRPQKELGAAARMKNLERAFSPVGDPKGRTVLLCDDLVTTGAGMATSARILAAQGAARVLGVSVAVTPKKLPVKKPAAAH